MNVFTKSLLLSTAIAAIPAALPAMAQDLDLGTIVVTPNRTPTGESSVGSTVAIIDREDIEEQSQPVIIDYLDRVPGIHVSPQGGMGKETSLTLRGADKKYVKTLFNGIDISDPTATQVYTSYEHLLSSGVSRIEVLKGSQSTLYGSDAVAGVIDISTLPDDEPGLTQRMMVEGGSHETGRASYGLSSVTDTGRMAVNIGGLYTGGISAAKINGNPLVDGNAGELEDDPYQNITGSFVGEQRISDTFSIFGAGLIINARNAYDGSSAGLVTDNDINRSDYQQVAGRAGFNLDLLDGRFRNTFSVQLMSLDRSISSVSTFDFGTGPVASPFDGKYSGQRAKVDYQGAYDLTDWLTLQFGSDFERQDAHITNNFGTDTTDDDHIAGVWTQALLTPVENLTLTAGLRHDQHSRFGGYTTYRGTAAYLFDRTGTKFRASVGTGFRAPSLYENNYVSFDPTVPVPNLDPEESFSWDVGIDQRLFDGRVTASLTYFELDTENLIDYDPIRDTYIQLPGTTHRRGVETAFAYDVTGWLSLGANYTYTYSVEADGDRRPRIPRHAIGVTASAQPWEKWEFAAAAKVAIDTMDLVGSDLVGLDDYAVVNAKVAYKPTEDSELYLRAENLFGEKYETVRGYAEPGFSIFAGFKTKL